MNPLQGSPGHQPPVERRGYKYWMPRVRAIFVGAAVLGVGATLTLAAWTDTEYTSASFKTSVFGIVGTPSTSVAFSENNDPLLPVAMALPAAAAKLSPTTQVYSSFFIKSISSSVSGTVALSGMSVTSAPSSLQSAIVYGVRVIGAGATCNAESYRTANIAAVGSLNNGADPTVGAVPLSTPASTTQTVAPNGEATLHYCFMFALPANAASTLQGQTVSGKWAFTGTSAS